MASSVGITDFAFSRLLYTVSTWYDKFKYISMLKVLYRDHVFTSGIENTSMTLVLLNALNASGYLHSKDISILYDTINVTKTFGLEKIIKHQIPSCPNIRDVIISNFTDHRQKIMKFGMVLKDNDVETISRIYNRPTPVKKYADSWSLIMDLEHHMIFEEMEDFIEKLKENELLQAVNALKEGTGDKGKTIHSSDFEATRSTPETFQRTSVELPIHHDVGLDQGITYRELLSIFSGWYDQYNQINMLKVLYRDHVKETLKLNQAVMTYDLLRLLRAAAELDPKDITILYDTIKATQSFGLVTMIKHLIPSCLNVKDITISRFTTHRQSLIKLGMALSDQDIVKISRLYNRPLKEYADAWRLIMDLEHRTIICEEKMEEFIDNLKKYELHQAVKVLTEGIGGKKKYKCKRHSSSDSEDIPHPSPKSREDSKALSDVDFGILKTVVSNWYDSQKSLPMLKVLFRDTVKKEKLSKVTDTMGLLDNLFILDHLSSQNLGLLWDTISITEQFALQRKIKELLSFLDVKERTISTNFTPHRQKLIKFGLELDPANMAQIDGIYNTLCKNYTDNWSMITDLEDRLIISEENMKKFIASLRILNPSQAVNTLKEGLECFK